MFQCAVMEDNQDGPLRPLDTVMKDTNAALQLSPERYSKRLAVIVAYLMECPLFYAFTATSDIPMDIVLDAYRHIKSNESVEYITLSFLDAQGVRHRVTVTQELFGTILRLPEATAPMPSTSEVSHLISVLAQLPFKADRSIKYSRSKLPLFWQFITANIIRCLFGQAGYKSDGNEKIWRLMFAFYYDIAIDFRCIIWNDFTTYLNRYNNDCRHPRWIALIIDHFLQPLSLESRLYINRNPSHGMITEFRQSHKFKTTFPLPVPRHIERCLSIDSPSYPDYIAYRDHGSDLSKSKKRQSSASKGTKQKKSKKTVPPQTTQPSTSTIQPSSSPVQAEVTDPPPPSPPQPLPSPLGEPVQPEVPAQMTPPMSPEDVYTPAQPSEPSALLPDDVDMGFMPELNACTVDELLHFVWTYDIPSGTFDNPIHTPTYYPVHPTDDEEEDEIVMNMEISEEASIIPHDEPYRPDPMTAMVAVRQPILSLASLGLSTDFFVRETQSPRRPDLTVATTSYIEQQTSESPSSPSSTPTEDDAPDQTPSFPSIVDIMRSLTDLSDITQSTAIHVQTIDGRISALDGRVSSLSSHDEQIKRIVDAAISDTVQRMDSLHKENVASISTNYEMRISGLEATISQMQQAMVVPSPPVPTAADVVNQHVQQQLDLLKHSVSILTSSGNALAANANQVANQVSSLAATAGQMTNQVSSLVQRASQSDRFETETRSQLGEILRLLTVAPVLPTDAPVGETQSRTTPTPIPTQTISSPPRDIPSPRRETPSPPKNTPPPPLSTKTNEAAAKRAETILHLNKPQEQQRESIARQRGNDPNRPREKPVIIREGAQTSKKPQESPPSKDDPKGKKVRNSPPPKKKQKPVLRYDADGIPLPADRAAYDRYLEDERQKKIANEVYNTVRIPAVVKPITIEMRKAWFKTFKPTKAGPSYKKSLHRNPELDGFLTLRSIHPKKSFDPPKDSSELWDFPPPPNAKRYYLWPKQEARDDKWNAHTWQNHRDAFFRKRAQYPSSVWSRTKLSKITDIRVQKFSGHSYIAFNIERPGEFKFRLTEADFPNLNQHDLETIVLWLKSFRNSGIATRIFLKRIRQYVYEMLFDFRVDYELAHVCQYEDIPQPSLYKKQMEGKPPGVVPGVGLAYRANDELRIFRFNDKHMYPTIFLDGMIQHMTICFQETKENSYKVMIKELRWYLAFREWLLRMQELINFDWPYNDV